jgi:hypothetical protein
LAGQTEFKDQVVTIDKEWLRRKLTVQEAEKENMYYDRHRRRPGHDGVPPGYEDSIYFFCDKHSETCLLREPIPFGVQNRRWKELLAEMTDGDEIWTFSSSETTWRSLMGREGVPLVRNGEVIAVVLTRFS